MTPEQRKHFEWVRDNMHGEKQEPVIGIKIWLEDGELVTQSLTAKDIYKDQPQRTWVGLTDEEMKELWENKGWYVTMFKAVEAKLKEKNT